MANSLISGLFGAPALKVVNETTTYSVWTKLKVVKVEFSNSAAVTDDPVSLDQVTDAGTYQALVEDDLKAIKIIQPTRIRITALCPDMSTFDNVLAGFANVEDTFTVTSKAIIAPSMTMSSLNLEQSSDNLSSSKLVIELEQAQPTFEDAYDPFQEADANTYGTRIQKPISLTTSVQTLYSKVSTYIKSAL
jgi:hypothetical protein